MARPSNIELPGGELIEISGKLIVPQMEVTETARVQVRLSPIHGRGAFARTDIPAGTRVIEYIGERISKEESIRRCERNNEYIFALNEQFDLDGNIPANAARYLNHSCVPNCEAELQEGHIWIVARRGIGAGEELTFNYGFDLIDYREHPCRCGAAECTGYIVAEEFFEHLRTKQVAG